MPASLPSSQDTSNSSYDSEGASSQSLKSAHKITQPRPSAKPTQAIDSIGKMRGAEPSDRPADIVLQTEQRTGPRTSKEKSTTHATGSMGKFKLKRQKIVPRGVHVDSSLSAEPMLLYASSDKSISPASSHRSAVSVNAPASSSSSSSTTPSSNDDLDLHDVESMSKGSEGSKISSTGNSNERLTETETQPYHVGRIETWFARWPHRAAAIDSTVTADGVHEDFNRIVNAVCP